MEWIQLPLGPVQANAYVVSNENGDAVIIDPGAEPGRLISAVKEKEQTPVAVLLTHAHFDHIGAVDEIRDEWSIPVYLHRREADWLGDPEKNGSAFFPSAEGKVSARAADHVIREEGELDLGSFSFFVFETPGHSPGSVSFYNREHNIVFSGDTLFAGSIGRTDLPGGDHEQLLQNIGTKLLTLPENTVAAPGHGPETTIGAEKQTNPFLAGL